MAVGNELTIVIRAVDMTTAAFTSAKANMAGLTYSWQQFNREVASTTRTLAMVTAALTTATVAAVGKAISEFEKFESALATLRMALRGTTEEEMASLEAMLIRISKILPVSVYDLTTYATEVAKLGIRGTEEIEKMVVAAVKFREATDSLVSAETAIKSLGKIAVAFDIDYEDVERIGSVITALSLTSPAQFEEVLEETQKLAAMGKAFGLTMPQTAAMITQVLSYGHVAGRTGLRLSRSFQLLIQNNKMLSESALETARAYGLLDHEFIKIVQGPGLEKLLEEDPIEFLRQLAAFLEDVPGNIATIEELQGILGWMSTYFLPFVYGMSEEAEGMQSFTERLEIANKAWGEGSELTRLYEIRLKTLAAQQEIVAGNIETTVTMIGAGLSPAFQYLMEDILAPFSRRLVDISVRFSEMRLSADEAREAAKRAGEEIEEAWYFEVLERRLDAIADAIGNLLLFGDVKPAIHELSIGVGAVTLLVSAWKIAASSIVALRAFMATKLGGMAFNIGTAIISAHFVWEMMPERIKEAIDKATDEAAKAIEDWPIAGRLKDAIQGWLDKLGEEEWTTVITLGLTFAIASGAFKALMFAITNWLKTSGLKFLGTGAAGVVNAGLTIALLTTIAMTVAEIARGEYFWHDLLAKLNVALALGGATWALTGGNIRVSGIMATMGFSMMPTVEEIKENPDFAADLAAKLTASFAAYGIVFAFTRSKWAASIAMVLTLTFMPDVGQVVSDIVEKATGEDLLESGVGKFALQISDIIETLKSSIAQYPDIYKMPLFDTDWLWEFIEIENEIKELARTPGVTMQDLVNYWTDAVRALKDTYPQLAEVIDAATQQIIRKLFEAEQAAAEGAAVAMERLGPRLVPDFSKMFKSQYLMNLPEDPLGLLGEKPAPAPKYTPKVLNVEEQLDAWLKSLYAGEMTIDEFITNVLAAIKANADNIDVVNALSRGFESVYSDASSASQALSRFGITANRAREWLESLASVISVEAQFGLVEAEFLQTLDTTQFIDSVTAMAAANSGNIDAINAISSAVDYLMKRMEDAADFLELVLSPEEAAALRAALDVLTERFGKASSAVESFIERIGKAPLPEALDMISRIMSLTPTSRTQGGATSVVAIPQAVPTIEQVRADLLEKIGTPGFSLKASMAMMEKALADAAEKANEAAPELINIGDFLETAAGSFELAKFITLTNDIQSAVTMVHGTLSFLENIVLATTDVELKKLILESEAYKMLRMKYDEWSREYGPEIIPPTPIEGGPDTETDARAEEIADAIRQAVGIIAPSGSHLPQIATVVTELATGNYVQAFLGTLQLIRNVVDEWKRNIEEAVGNVTDALGNLAARAEDLAQSFLDLITQSQQFADVQRALAGVQSALINTLLGFLSPIRWVIEFVLGFFEEEAEAAAEEAQAVRKTTASLNVPTGYKLERAAWGVAAPGQPWGEEDWRDTERQLRDVFDNVPKWLKEIIEGFRAALEEAGQGIKAFVDEMQWIWQELAPGIIEALLPVLSYFGDALGWVSGIVYSVLFPVLAEHLPQILGNLGRAFSDLIASGLVVLTGFIARVAIPVIDTFADALAGAASWIRSVLVPDLLGMFATIGEWWNAEVDPFLKEEVFPKLQEWLLAIYNWLSSEFGPFLLDEVWPFLKGPVWDAIVEGLTLLGDVFMDIWHTVEDKWPQIKDWIINKIGEFFEGIASDWQTATDAVLFEIEGFGGVVHDVVYGIRDLLLRATDIILLPVKLGMNAIILAANAVIDLINLLPGVNIPSLPYVPLFEKGGHVIEEGLAYLHRGETVVPARATPYGGQSITIQQMTVVANDPEEFMEKMEEAIRRKNLRGIGQRYGSYATAGA